ncbi:MAG: prepilin peptidase [Terracidiphilus sp.]|jgi:prepilin peptidase CpaA
MQHWLAWWPTVIVLAVATFTDLRSRRIPNWLVFPFLFAGILVSPLRNDWSGIGRGFWLRTDWTGIRHGFWHGLGQSFAGIGLGLLIFGLPFVMGWTGGGDVKLCAAIGAWVGPVQLFFALIVTSMAGGIIVLGWAVFGGFARELFSGALDLIFGWKQDKMRPNPAMVISNPLKRKIPYAPAIAIGTLMSFFAG